MNRIDITQVVDPDIQQPFTALSVDFWQNENKRMVDALSKGIIKSYSNGVGYILYGCVDNGSSVTAGAIYYTGELYVVDAVPSYSLSMGQVLIATASNTNDATADPCTFSDGTSKNVHNVRKIAIGVGTSGAGLFDLSAAIRIEKPKTVIVSLSAINSNFSSSVLIFDTEETDTEGIHSTVNGKLTPKKAGYYRMSGFVHALYDATPSASTAGVYIKKNGSTYIQPFYADVKTTTVHDTYVFNEVVYANGTTDYFQLAFSDSVANYVTLDGRMCLDFVRE